MKFEWLAVFLLLSFPVPAAALQVTIRGSVPIAQGVHGLAVDTSGRLLFSDSFGSGALWSWEPPFAGAPKSTSVQSALPAGILAMGELIYLCDTKNGELVELDSSFKPLRKWDVNFPWNVVQGRAGE